LSLLWPLKLRLRPLHLLRALKLRLWPLKLRLRTLKLRLRALKLWLRALSLRLRPLHLRLLPLRTRPACIWRRSAVPATVPISLSAAMALALCKNRTGGDQN